MELIKRLSLTCILLLIIVSVEVVLLVAFTGAGINKLIMPIFSNLDFLWLLTKSNFHAGIIEIINQPVLIIGNATLPPADFLSALYYYPVSSLLHIGLAWLISTRMVIHKSRPHKYSFFTGCALFLVTINYIWLAACCGASPGWTLDTIFLNYVMSSEGTPIQHMNIYDAVYRYMQPLQLLVMILASMLIWRGMSSSSKH